MKNTLRNVRDIWKQSASEIKVNWKLSRRVQGTSQKMKMYMLLYMNTVFFLFYTALIYVAVLFILVGLIGGALLGIKESPYYFLLFLLPVTSLPFVYIVNFAWTNYYSVFKKDFFEKYSIQVPQGE